MSKEQNKSGHLVDEATKTPRTDAELKLEAFFDGFGIVETVEIEFAQELETELADARAEIEQLKHQLEDESMRADGMTTAHAEAGAKNYRQQELIEQMREALEACAEFIHYYDQEHNIGDGKVLEQAIAALSTAERGE